MKYKFCTIV